MNILKKIAAALPADVATIEQRRTDALAAFDTARAALGEASLSGDGLEAARKALAHAEAALVEADSALDAAKARQTRADVAAKAKQAEQRAQVVTAGCTAIGGTLTELDATIDTLRDQTVKLMGQFDQIRPAADGGALAGAVGRIRSALQYCVGRRLLGLAEFPANAFLDDQRARIAFYAPTADMMLPRRK